jgi:hypothetical protein
VDFLFVPVTIPPGGRLPGEKTTAVAGLMNFMGNIGQSVGTLAVTSLIATQKSIPSPSSPRGDFIYQEDHRHLHPHFCGIEPG